MGGEDQRVSRRLPRETSCGKHNRRCPIPDRLLLTKHSPWISSFCSFFPSVACGSGENIPGGGDFIISLFSLLIAFYHTTFHSRSLSLDFCCFVALRRHLSVHLAAVYCMGKRWSRLNKKKKHHSLDHNAGNTGRRTIRFPLLYVLLRCQLAR